MDNLLVNGSYIFGLFVVIIFSIKEFNAPEYNYHDKEDDDSLIDKSPYAKLAKPTLPKYMADTSRYNVFMVIFIAIAALVYVGFAKLLLIMPGAEYITDDNEALAALLSALILVGIVKSDDFGSKRIQFFMKWPKTVVFVLWKNLIHNSAYIPGLSCDVFNALCYEEIDLNSEVVKKNIDGIVSKKYREDFNTNQYIEANDFNNTGNPTGMIARWSRLSYFIFVVDKWSTDAKFMNQVKERSLGWGALIKEGYIPLIGKIAEYRDKNVNMTQGEEEELSKQLDHLLANCYRLIACIVVMTARASENPLYYIKRIGLNVHPGGRMYSRRGEFFRMIFALVPTIAVIVVIYAVVGPTIGPEQVILNIINYSAYAGIIMIFPIILVFALKCHMSLNKTWRIVTPETSYKSFFDMPLGIYTMVSILAWIISLLSMMVFMSGKDLMTSNMLQWKSASIFCFISATTAFITCYRTDIPPKVYKSNIKRWSFIGWCSVVHGSFTALIVWVGLILSGTKYDSESLIEFPLLGFVIAVIIGFTLFYGKHKTEQRNLNDRKYCTESVMVRQGDYKVPAIMLNKSPTGVMLMLSHARSLIKDNNTIEIIFNNGMRKVGSIVRRDAKHLNVAYQQ
jgi:hypothetical protein